MARNKTINEKIEAVKAKKEQYENEMKRLIQQQNEQERKARTHRLCERGGYLESIMPDTITLTDEQFRLFLDKTLLTDYSRRTLAAIKTGQTKPAADSHTEAERNGGADAPKAESNGARQGA